MFQTYGDLRGVTRHPGAHQAHLASFSVEFYSIQVSVDDVVSRDFGVVCVCGFLWAWWGWAGDRGGVGGEGWGGRVSCPLFSLVSAMTSSDTRLSW